MAQLLLGIFRNRADADAAIDDLKAADFSAKDISIVMQDGKESSRTHESNPIAEGAVSGAATGAVIGGIAGLLVGIGAIAVPGLGALLVGGPLVAAFGVSGATAATVTGAATGVIAGGIIGALVHLGVPEEDARGYEEDVRSGAVLVVVHAGDRSLGTARGILEDNNAEKIRSFSV